MNDYWKKKLDNFVEETLKNTDKKKKIIFIGLVTHYKYSSKKIKLKTNNKYFLKLIIKKMPERLLNIILIIIERNYRRRFPP